MQSLVNWEALNEHGIEAVLGSIYSDLAIAESLKALFC